jgi:predicted small lipoprotein YifL
VPLLRSRPLRVTLLVGLMGLSLAACGRKGPLEAPPTAENAVELPAEQVGGVPNTLDASPVARTKKPDRGIIVPNTPFPLDPLL